MGQAFLNRFQLVPFSKPSPYVIFCNQHIINIDARIDNAQDYITIRANDHSVFPTRCHLYVIFTINIINIDASLDSFQYQITI